MRVVDDNPVMRGEACEMCTKVVADRELLTTYSRCCSQECFDSRVLMVQTLLVATRESGQDERGRKRRRFDVGSDFLGGSSSLDVDVTPAGPHCDDEGRCSDCAQPGEECTFCSGFICFGCSTYCAGCGTSGRATTGEVDAPEPEVESSLKLSAQLEEASYNL